MNQIAEAGVGSMEDMLEGLPATLGVAKGASSELPACRLRRVTQYIQENLQRELRLTELSAFVHMSPYHFARLFRQSIGMPPHKFVVRSIPPNTKQTTWRKPPPRAWNHPTRLASERGMGPTGPAR